MIYLSYLRKLGHLKYLIFALPLLLISPHACADQKTEHKEGKVFAKKQAVIQRQAVKSFELKDVPGFKTDKPPEADMSVAQLDARKESVLESNKNASFLAKTINEKPYIKIDPVNDAAFKRANNAAANPTQTINQDPSDDMVQDLNAEVTRHTCEESKEASSYVCAQTRLIEIDVPTTKTHIVSLKVKSWRWRHGLGRNVITGQKLDDSYVSSRNRFEASTTLLNPLPQEFHNRVERVKLLKGKRRVSLASNGDLKIDTYKQDKEKINLDYTLDVEITYRPIVQNGDISEHISDSCGPLKAKAEQGFCKFIKEVIVDGAGPKDFNDHAITRPWWKKESTYQCHYPSLNNCGPYRQKGCDQVGSTCKTMVGDICAVSEQTFVCRPLTKKVPDGTTANHAAPFCMNGNCSEPQVVANKDMMAAISRLSVLNEAQGEINKDNLFVFKGCSNTCRHYIASFKNCCGTGKGWGKSIGFGGCKPEEKQLEDSRSKGLCRKIGTYCSKDSILGCLKEKTTFCCFPTKIAKVFHEQGRKQLGIGWGSKEKPDCRGFTIEELSRLDFSKLDLSELYKDIAKTMKKPNLAGIKRGLQNRVEVMVLDSNKEAKI